MTQTQEWRVSYRRGEGGRLQHKIYQSEAGARRWALILQGRMSEAYPDTDPEGFPCCDGSAERTGWHCGCGGKTWREHWDSVNASFAEVGNQAVGVVVECREVEGWTAALGEQENT